MSRSSRKAGSGILGAGGRASTQLGDPPWNVPRPEAVLVPDSLYSPEPPGCHCWYLGTEAQISVSSFESP